MYVNPILKTWWKMKQKLKKIISISINLNLFTLIFSFLSEFLEWYIWKVFLCRCCAILNMGIPQKLFCDLPSFAYICIEELLEEKKKVGEVVLDKEEGGRIRREGLRCRAKRPFLFCILNKTWPQLNQSFLTSEKIFSSFFPTWWN